MVEKHVHASSCSRILGNLFFELESRCSKPIRRELRRTMDALFFHITFLLAHLAFSFDHKSCGFELDMAYARDNFF